MKDITINSSYKDLWWWVRSVEYESALCPWHPNRLLSLFMTSVLTTTSSYTIEQNASVPPFLLKTAMSLLGSPSQRVISNCTFPSSPIPALIQYRDVMREFSWICSSVIHFVSSFWWGSGPGFTLFYDIIKQNRKNNIVRKNWDGYRYSFLEMMNVSVWFIQLWV